MIAYQLKKSYISAILIFVRQHSVIYSFSLFNLGKGKALQIELTWTNLDAR